LRRSLGNLLCLPAFSNSSTNVVLALHFLLLAGLPESGEQQLQGPRRLFSFNTLCKRQHVQRVRVLLGSLLQKPFPGRFWGGSSADLFQKLDGRRQAVWPGAAIFPSRKAETVCKICSAVFRSPISGFDLSQVNQHLSGFPDLLVPYRPKWPRRHQSICHLPGAREFSKGVSAGASNYLSILCGSRSRLTHR